MVHMIGLVATFGLILVGMGEPLIFLDDRALFIVYSATLWGAISATGKRVLQMAPVTFRVLRGNSNLTAEDLFFWVSAFRTTIQCTIAGGFSAAIMGFILMLVNLDDPARIGPAMALALLGMLYALIIAYLLLLPLQTCFEKQMAETLDAEISPANTPLDLLTVAGGVIVGAVTFTLLLASF